jgi:hypothetical protein
VLMGPMGPEHLPGHGHADALSFVLYGKHEPLVVDPGVYSYHEKSWRDHFRSTKAHNTVCIDGQDQCVFWGVFRVAYPPRVRLLGWSDEHVEGQHEGYLRLKDPVVHRRLIRKRGKGIGNCWTILPGEACMSSPYLCNWRLRPGWSGMGLPTQPRTGRGFP